MISTSACSQDSKVEDKAQIKSLYEQMYKAMVEKDTATLSALHHDSFVLTHMTGMRQGKKEYINASRARKSTSTPSQRARSTIMKPLTRTSTLALMATERLSWGAAR